MKYSVGQVVYVCIRKETRVYPMQVTKEITEKTLDGEKTSYVFRGGTDPKAQLLLAEIDGEVFDSAEKARVVLIERATQSINRLVTSAVNKAREWYPSLATTPVTDDGTLSFLKKTSPATNAAMPSVHDAVAELQEELRQEANALDESASVMVLPDGGKVKVRSVKLPESLQ